MKLLLILSIRYLISSKKRSFSNTASILSVLGLGFGISALLVTLFILNGFERVISEKISEFDGHIRIHHFLREPVSSNFILKDSSIFNQNMVDFISPNIQSPALLRYGKLSEGVFVEAVNSQRIKFLSPKIIDGKLDIKSNSAIIGSGLAFNLNLSIGDKISLFDISTLNSKEKKLKQFIVKAVFHSGLNEYDKSSIYISLKNAKNLFSFGKNYSGYILNLKDVTKAKLFSRKLKNELLYPLTATTWKEKNQALFKWMNIQRLPILFIFSLIALVAIVNIVSSISMIVIDKTSQIGLLLSLGMTVSNIKKIFIFQGFFIGLIGTFLGSFLSVMLSFLQNNFKLISVPEDVYFMKYIPLDVSINNILVIAFFSIIFSIMASIWPAIRASSIEPATALKYE